MNRLPFAPLSHDASLTSAWHLVGDVFKARPLIPVTVRLGKEKEKKKTETSLAATGNKTTC